MKLQQIWVFILIAFIGFGLSSARAQSVPAVQGDFVGTLGPLHLKLHIVAGTGGALSGTMDSPDQGSIGIPCADFQVQGQTISFAVPAVHGNWTGAIADDGRTLTGTWNQGSPQPLTFTRDTFIPADKPSPVDGFWLGILQAGSQSLRIQISVKSDRSGQESCALDSLDQDAFDLSCANVARSGTDFSFNVPALKGRWSGKLSSDAQTLTGTWSQGAPLPLNLQRQATPVPPTPPPKVSYIPAMAPVDAAGMQAVLNQDLEQALKRGALSPGTSAGVAIGVVRGGTRRVFAYGAARTDSIFEIGSITKTFTGLAMAQLIAQGKIRLDEPVRELLPSGAVAKPPGAEITLLDLITQHSGLPRMPDNFNPADPSNPYRDYRPANLYQFVAQHGVAKPADAAFLYSNLGVGLLGQALADRAAMPYANLLNEEVTGPLRLRDTVVSLSPEQQQHFIQGHDPDHNPSHAWDFDALAGAGAIRSTAADMLTYLEANLHPEKQPQNASANGRTLPVALAQSHELRAEAGPGMQIAFAWLYESATGTYWHNGATGGYSSYAFFNPSCDCAAVVLMNTTISNRGSFADRLGQHIGQRFAGRTAISLAD
ncbi:MAG TPA: serine hydrolase domain-containing protein [Candidatus Binataceae bacterium]|jgi:CubicO group peptidase (beta-lactamase class C family)